MGTMILDCVNAQFVWRVNVCLMICGRNHVPHLIFQLWLYGFVRLLLPRVMDTCANTIESGTAKTSCATRGSSELGRWRF